jgi:hypothetical protein
LPPCAQPYSSTTAPFAKNMLDFERLNSLIGTPDLLARGKKYEE